MFKKITSIILCVLVCLTAMGIPALKPVTATEAPADGGSPAGTALPSATATPELELAGGDNCVAMRTLDNDGEPFSAPSGKRDEKVLILLPLMCLDGPLYDVSIKPVVSTSLETFPFDIEQLDYTQRYESVAQTGTTFEFLYNFTIGHYVTKGVKQVSFTLSYRYGSADAPLTECNFDVFLTVTRGYTESSGGSLTPETTQVPLLKPKLVVESYSIATERLYAGDEFVLNFVIRNTSSEQAVRNLQLELSEASGVILPANNGSSSLYVDEIGAGQSKELELHLQSSPDADAKPYTISADMDYNGAKDLVSYTASGNITFTLEQRIRTKFNDIIIYDDAWLGSSCSMSLQFFNLGKSTIYNCAIDVDCEGLVMEEPFFAGNVNSGGNVYADFAVVPSIGGELSGDIVVSYEDSYGEVMETRIPLSLYVNEQSFDPAFEPGKDISVDDPYSEPEQPGNVGRSLSTFWWVLIAAVVIAGVVVLIVLLRKRRKRKLGEV